MKILLGTTSILLLVILWLTVVTIPNKEKEIAWINAQADSIAALPPQVEYIPGKTITEIIRDTVEVFVDGAPVIQVDSVATSAFNDGFIKGTIYAEGQVKSLRFSYRPIVPFYSSSRTDTVYIKQHYPKLINRADLVAYRRDWYVSGELSFGYDRATFSYMPGVSLTMSSRNALGYSYDISSKTHWISVRLPLKR